jgi:hypothetical protein
MDDEKLAAIREERGKIYGDPYENHRLIGMMWTTFLAPIADQLKNGEAVPPHVVALMMAALKLNRMRLKFHQDNYDDCRNYLKFAEDWQPTNDA